MPVDRTARTLRSRNHVNLLLRLLPPGDLRLIEPHLHLTRLSAGEILVSPKAPITRVLFPEQLLVSFSGKNAIEAGLVGHEGMIGWSLLLGSDASPLTGRVALQDGTAIAIDGHRLLQACHISQSLNMALLRYVNNFMAQLACNIASTAAHSAERRIARLLLMLHDRAEGDALALTHDHVSSALHVRRATVTDCLHLLEGDGLLRCTRGRILIRDRPGLEQIAGNAYGSVETHYARDIGLFGKSAMMGDASRASKAELIPR
jgi:CRP-like cAMP-binding protein